MNPIESELKVEIGSFQTGNIPLLLHEIRHALRKLLDTRETTTIDLRGLPMAPGEMDKLLGFLGQGEITAQLNALGRSEISETAFHGVWLVVHYNAENDVMGKFIEITSLPTILVTQPDDMEDSLASLQIKLEEL